MEWSCRADRFREEFAAMKPVSCILASSLTLVALWACNGEQNAATTTGTPATTAAETTTSEATTAETTTSEATATEDTASATDTDSAADTVAKTKDPAPSATGNPTAEASAAPANKYDCGGKGQKACPMQGWMKGVMARAVASGDGDKIAQALNTVASKPVAGFDSWSAIAAEGAAKAKAGDIEGAKNSCKKCHGLYQKKYVDTMRDRPW